MLKERRLRLAEVISFSAGKSIKPGGQGAYPVYGSNGIIGASDQYLYENALIIGRVGAYCGSVAYSPGKFWASDNTLVVRPITHEFDVRFLYYLLRNADLRRHAGGAAQPLVTQTVLRQVEVRVPSLIEQRRIAGILSAYDDLIENCERRIRVLDEMARILYREWFVLFRYPSHEKTPLVESPLGRIPKDWSIAPLGKHARVQKGLSYKGDGLTDEGVPMVNLKCILAGGVFRRDGVKPYSGEYKDRHRLGPGDIVFANTDLTQAGGIIGSVARVPRRGFEEGGIASHHISILRPNDPQIHVWLLCALRDDRFRNFVRGRASGTTVLGFRTDDAEAYELLMPPPTVCDAFTTRAAPLLDASELLEDRIDNLRKTRDLLLPRLLSGQLSGEDAA